MSDRHETASDPSRLSQAERDHICCHTARQLLGE